MFKNAPYLDQVKMHLIDAGEGEYMSPKDYQLAHEYEYQYEYSAKECANQIMRIRDGKAGYGF